MSRALGQDHRVLVWVVVLAVKRWVSMTSDFFELKCGN